MGKPKTATDATAGAPQTLGGRPRAPFVSNMKTHTGYQFAKSGVNSRSSMPNRSANNFASNPAFGNVVHQIADKNKPDSASHRRESTLGKQATRAPFEKYMKTSVSQAKHPMDSFGQDHRLNKSVSHDSIITFKNKLKPTNNMIKFEKKDLPCAPTALTTALENVQRLNEEIKQQNN